MVLECRVDTTDITNVWAPAPGLNVLGSKMPLGEGDWHRVKNTDKG